MLDHEFNRLRHYLDQKLRRARAWWVVSDGCKEAAEDLSPYEFQPYFARNFGGNSPHFRRFENFKTHHPVNAEKSLTNRSQEFSASGKKPDVEQDLMGNISDPETTKPSFQSVYEYAQKSVGHYINKLARKLTDDQKEEVSQDAMLRVWQAYQDLDAARGWKSFVQLHCRGACLDYLKAGRSDIESELTANEPKNKSDFETETVKYKYKQTTMTQEGLKFKDVEFTRTQIKANHSRTSIRAKRVEIRSDKDDGGMMSLDDTCAIFGVYQGDVELKTDMLSPKWDLLGRLAGLDEDLHIIAKVILGYSQEQIAEQYGSVVGVTISRERISQRIYELFERFDSIQHLHNPKVKQSIFALGLCRYYHEPEIDQGIGWDLEYFDLANPDSFKIARRYYTPSFFDLDINFSEETPVENSLGL
jgi:hypothetical protein